jgi:hypothetical protein
LQTSSNKLKCGNYSRGKLFKEADYSRAETICGNIIYSFQPKMKILLFFSMLR